MHTLVLLVVAVLSWWSPKFGAPDLKPVDPAPGYQHDRWGTEPSDHVFEMRAYVASFDSDDDDDGDGQADSWGIPEFVAYELRAFDGELGKGPKRPSKWIHDDEMHESGQMPKDESYHFSRAWREQHPDSPMLGFDRGHLCMKIHAFRLGEHADWNTHTMWNCVPQRADLNQGIWLDLEKQVAAWADKYGAVWTVTGPIVFGHAPSAWLGQEDETPVAIPDAFFKILVKQAPNGGQDVLAFIYPQRGVGYRAKPFNHLPYLTSVDTIEALTGLDFLTNLDDEVETYLEQTTATALWE